MALRIKIPDSAYHEQKINLDNNTFTLVLKYNNSDKYYYFDLLDINEEPLVSGVKIMPNQNLTGRYKYQNLLGNGNIWCLRTKNDFSDVGRNNLGFDKTYELVWYSSSEELELGINDTVQL